MVQIISAARKTLVAVVALTGSLLMAEAAHAGHRGRRTCHPAAEAHLKTAIRLMQIARDKPLQASKGLARATVVHLSLAQRFVRTPAADAELYAAEALLKRFIHRHWPFPFCEALERTRLALALERGLCACGRSACGRACAVRRPPRARYWQEPHAGPRWDYGSREYGDRHYDRVPPPRYRDEYDDDDDDDDRYRWRQRRRYHDD